MIWKVKSKNITYQKFKMRDPVHEALGRWSEAYREEARRDRYRKLRARLNEKHTDRPLTLRGARKFVEETVRLVETTVELLGCDQRTEAAMLELIEKQVYDLEASATRYLTSIVDFDLRQRSLLVDCLDEVDLDDLVGASRRYSKWNLLFQLEITRANGARLGVAERKRLGKMAVDDLMFDRVEGRPPEVFGDPWQVVVNLAELV